MKSLGLFRWEQAENALSRHSFRGLKLVFCDAPCMNWSVARVDFDNVMDQ